MTNRLTRDTEHKAQIIADRLVTLHAGLIEDIDIVDLLNEAFPPLPPWTRNAVLALIERCPTHEGDPEVCGCGDIDLIR